MFARLLRRDFLTILHKTDINVKKYQVHDLLRYDICNNLWNKISKCY